jgi:hypothetical protein
MTKQKEKLQDQRKNLMKQLAQIGPFMEGTLTVTPRMCRSTGCACQRGKKHLAMYLTWKEDQKTRSLYIPVNRQKEAKAMSQTYKKLKPLLRKLSGTHKKLLVLKE